MAVPPGQPPQGRRYPPHQGPPPSGKPQPPSGRPQHRRPQYGQPPFGQQPGPPPPGYPAAGYGPPQHGAPPHPGPPPRSRGVGKIVLIVVGVLVVLLGLGVFAIFQFVSTVASTAGGLVGGVGTSCPAVPTGDVNAALGGSYDVIELGGLGGLVAPVLDSRVLADAPTCWAVETGTEGRLARIARYSGADAAQRFAAEKSTAMGTSEDRGGGITVSSDGYFARDVPAGDEAFCTTGDFTASAGVLVRRGDLLVYVSTNAAGNGAASVPDIDLEAGTFGTDGANCELAIALAGKVS